MYNELITPGCCFWCSNPWSHVLSKWKLVTLIIILLVCWSIQYECSRQFWQTALLWVSTTQPQNGQYINKVKVWIVNRKETEGQSVTPKFVIVFYDNSAFHYLTREESQMSSLSECILLGRDNQSIIHVFFILSDLAFTFDALMSTFAGKHLDSLKTNWPNQHFQSRKQKGLSVSISHFSQYCLKSKPISNKVGYLTWNRLLITHLPTPFKTKF